MSEDELAASEVVGEGGWYTPPVEDERWELAVTPARLRELGALGTEVRRLRAALAEIGVVDPDEKSDGTILGYLRYDADEMASIAQRALKGESIDLD